MPNDLGKQTRLELTEALDSLAGSRIPQALYLMKLLQTVPGRWQSKTKQPTQLSGLTADDYALVVADLHNELVSWTGHEFAGHSTVNLAEILAGSADVLLQMTSGKAAWFIKLAAQPWAQQPLGINRHEGHTYLNREALEDYLQAMIICGLMDLVDDEVTPLLDARALILSAASEANYDLDVLEKTLG